MQVPTRAGRSECSECIQVESVLQNIVAVQNSSVGYNINSFVGNELYQQQRSEFDVVVANNIATSAAEDIDSPSLEDNCYMDDEGGRIAIIENKNKNIY